MRVIVIIIGVISLLTIIVGLIMPIGMFGFLAAVGLAIGVAAVLAFMPSGQQAIAAPAADLGGGVQDSLITRQGRSCERFLRRLRPASGRRAWRSRRPGGR